MGIPLLVRRHFYIESVPVCLFCAQATVYTSADNALDNIQWALCVRWGFCSNSDCSLQENAVQVTPLQVCRARDEGTWKYTTMYQNLTGVGPMLLTSSRCQPNFGTLWFVYRAKNGHNGTSNLTIWCIFFDSSFFKLLSKCDRCFFNNAVCLSSTGRLLHSPDLAVTALSKGFET